MRFFTRDCGTHCLESVEESQQPEAKKKSGEENYQVSMATSFHITCCKQRSPRRILRAPYNKESNPGFLILKT